MKSGTIEELNISRAGCPRVSKSSPDKSGKPTRVTDSRALRHRGLIEEAIVPEADIKSTCLQCSGNRRVALDLGMALRG